MYPKAAPVVRRGGAAARRHEGRRGHRQAAGEEDLYTFDVESDGLYEVRTSGSTDVYLKLFGPDSQTALVAEDDDSGYGVNARIRRSLVPGKYWAQVRHWNVETGTGKYSISARSR